MKKTYLIATLLGAFALSQSASAADDIYYLSIQDSLNSQEAKEALDPNIAVHFASGSGTVIQSGLVSNRKSNGVGKSDQASCQRAFLSAVKQFQATAKNNNATKVINLISFYKKQPYSSTTKYECHAGTIMSGVALKGDIAK